MKEMIKKFIPPFLLGWYHFFLAFFGAFFYGFPSKKMIVVGVTGTNGKSTVIEMCHQIFREAGFKVASISSIRFKINDNFWPNTLKMTMPGRFKLQRFLRKAVKSGCRYAILEVTSEGIKQHRQRFIDFDVAVLTNLTPEHIESHGSFEKYRIAKGKLFRALKTQKPKRKKKKVSIINLDDENAEYFLQFSADEKWGYKIKSKTKKDSSGSLRQRISKTHIKNLKIIEAEDICIRERGISFSIRNAQFAIGLIGEFNIYNALAAICVGLSQGVNLATIKSGLEKIKKVPGRMEVVIREPFKVVVDYAHTPDSLRKVYETLRSAKSKTKKDSSGSLRQRISKMICVLGSCGGGRDKWKRPELGRIAAQYCDEIILTNEDPYDENPNQILSEIKSGIFNFQFSIFNVYEILDRRKAIRKSLKLAKPGDTVIITGKGSEPWMCVAGGKKIPWDDRKIAKEEFKRTQKEIFL
jgi:UDP-N-acetylmuramoyl-L-alanyl-D-glutamate--2,6-diaminopimelate ligase